MVRSKVNQEEKISKSLSASQAIILLKKQQEKGRALLDRRPINRDSKAGWIATTHAILVKAFGYPSEMVKRFDWAGQRVVSHMGQPESYYEKLCFEEMTRKQNKYLFRRCRVGSLKLVCQVFK